MTDYGTVDQVKSRTSVTYEDFRKLTTDEFDTLVELLLGDASRAMESESERDWALHDNSADGKVYSVGAYNQRMVRINGPVIAITSVEIRDNPSGTYTTVDTQDYSHKNFPEFGPVAKSAVTHLKRIGFGQYAAGRLPRWWVNRIGSTTWLRWRVVWWRGYDNIRVKYTWGYATIPGDINRICLRIVDSWLKKSLKDEVGKRVKISTPEDLQMMMQYDIPDHLIKNLKDWKSTGGFNAL